MVEGPFDGKNLMAYKKFPVIACASFKKAVKVLQERFEPEICTLQSSRQDVCKTKSWPKFSEDLLAFILFWMMRHRNNWHYRSNCHSWIMSR